MLAPQFLQVGIPVAARLIVLVATVVDQMSL